MRVWVTVIVIASLMGWASQAFAEDEKKRPGVIELGVLTGVTIFFNQEEADVTGQFPSGAGGIYAPITPALRLTFWSQTPFLMDFGTSYYTSNVFDNTFSALNFEFALGLRTVGESRVVTSGSFLLGFVSWTSDSTTTDAYLGGNGTVRVFVNERTSARFQLGYRHTMRGPTEGFDIDALEVSVGIGVFL